MEIKRGNEIEHEIYGAIEELSTTEQDKLLNKKWVVVDDIKNRLQNMRKQTEEFTAFELLDAIIKELT